MSASILPNGSLVFHLADATVHINVIRGLIEVREPSQSAAGELAGRLMSCRAISAARFVRFLPEQDDAAHVYLELESGEMFDLGSVSSGPTGQRIARALAEATRTLLVTEIEPTFTNLPLPDLGHETPNARPDHHADDLVVTQRLDISVGRNAAQGDSVVADGT